VVEAQDCHAGRVLGNDGDIPIPGDLFDKVARWRFPPVHLAVLQCRHRRKRVQGQPLDPIEMCDLRSGGEADGAARARLVERKALEGCAGAADMLFGEEAIGAAAADLGDRFVGRGCRQTLGH